jgi:hypothetical protein
MNLSASETIITQSSYCVGPIQTSGLISYSLFLVLFSLKVTIHHLPVMLQWFDWQVVLVLVTVATSMVHVKTAMTI